VNSAPPELVPRIAGLLQRGQWSERTKCTRLSGGSRHKVYRLDDGDRAAVLKLYGAAGVAAREPFEHETVVHRFFARHCPESVPVISDVDEAARCVLFEWVEGERPSAGQINPAAMVQMAAFVAALNQPAVLDDGRAASVPHASDAAFDFAGHRERAWLRLEALLGSERHEPVVEDMKRFVQDELVPACRQTTEPGDRLLMPSEYALSPSDFGFHNVIVRPGGPWVFLDFEHAGWDDPAKLVADFFLQPECPLDGTLQQAFLFALQGESVFGDDLAERVTRLLPLQAVKWTAVILNVFHHDSPAAATARLQSRLAKAKSYWARRGTTILRHKS
jgi:Ser/Thr protein kinase RdoA (MazF antagonist)